MIIPVAMINERKPLYGMIRIPRMITEMIDEKNRCFYQVYRP